MIRLSLVGSEMGIKERYLYRSAGTPRVPDTIGKAATKGLLTKNPAITAGVGTALTAGAVAPELEEKVNIDVDDPTGHANYLTNRGMYEDEWAEWLVSSGKAETKEEAERLAASRNLGRLFSITGRAKGIPSPEYASNYQYMVDELEFVQNYAKNCVDGDPETVANALNIISDNYETNDLSIVTICHSYEDRENSYKLVAHACGINIQ